MRTLLMIVTMVFLNTSHGAGIGVRAGTTGVGADYGWGIIPTLGGRVGLSGMKFNTDVDSGNLDYDAKVKLTNLSALLDWSPLGPFRISAGFVANNNKVDVTSQTGTFTLNGNTYSGSVSGTVEPGRSVAPYLGIGYGNVWTKGVNFYFDLGIMFQGSPKADLRVNCGASMTPVQCAQAQNDVQAEERRVEDELKRFKYYPVLNLGITIGF